MSRAGSRAGKRARGRTQGPEPGCPWPGGRTSGGGGGARQLAAQAACEPQHLGRFKQLRLEVGLCIFRVEHSDGASWVLGCGGRGAAMGGSLKKHVGAAAPSLGSEVWVLPKGGGGGLWRFPLKRMRNYSLKEAAEELRLWGGSEHGAVWGADAPRRFSNLNSGSELASCGGGQGGC